MDKKRCYRCDKEGNDLEQCGRCDEVACMNCYDIHMDMHDEDDYHDAHRSDGNDDEPENTQQQFNY